MIVVKLKKDRERSLIRKHPWVFSGAMNSVKGEPKNGETVKVISNDGKFLCWAAYSAKSQISLRAWSFNENETIDENFFYKQIDNALLYRKQFINSPDSNSYRLINAESDGLPGIIVDVYDRFVVCQFLSAGAEQWKSTIVKILVEKINPVGIYERSDVDVREKEGLKLESGVLFGETPPEILEIIENGNKFLIDIINGHKSGFYLDQKINRKLLADYSKDKEVLNCFSFSGGFALYALRAGAVKIINVDSSKDALMLAEKNILLNGFKNDQFENVEDDVFKYLRKLRDSNRKFDIIILDPPKFAESFNQIEKASRGYKDINLLAFKLLKPNGVLFTFSCSGHISVDLFNKIIADAALDSGRKVNVISYLTQSPDHTISTNFPESLYLKGLICSAQ
jgi:23S rRNA (cytosine1962-C5)-methyltransferase